MLKKLLSNTGWEWAIIDFKNRKPLGVEQKSCKCADEGDQFSITVSNSDMPLGGNAVGTAVHVINKDQVVSIAFYTENRITKV